MAVTTPAGVKLHRPAGTTFCYGSGDLITMETDYAHSCLVEVAAGGGRGNAPREEREESEPERGSDRGNRVRDPARGFSSSSDFTTCHGNSLKPHHTVRQLNVKLVIYMYTNLYYYIEMRKMSIILNIK